MNRMGPQKTKCNALDSLLMAEVKERVTLRVRGKGYGG